MTRAVQREQHDPIFGWRYWQLSPQRLLRSVTQRGFEWPPGRVLKAVCLEVGHPAPAEHCICGLYANPDLEALRQHGLCLAPDVIVIGQVALWGKVIVDEPSFRGEHAYPARLSLVVDSLIDDTPPEVLVAGLEAYRVPVHLTTLDEAVTGMSADMLRFQAMSRRTSGTWSRPGGGSIEHSGGALVVHGLTGSPQSVAPLAAAFDGAGFAVEVPLLPGHGTSPEDLAGVGWDDWTAAVEAAYAALAGRVDGGPVVVAGLSMGGALVAGLAAAHAEIAGLVAVNPFVDPPAPSFQALLADLLAAGEPYLPGIADAREDAYDRLPVAAFLSASRGLDRLAPRLGEVRCPVLIFTSRHDHVVPTVSSDVLAAAVSGPVEQVWLERSGHVATLDVEHRDLERRALAFAARAAERRTMIPVGLISRDDVAHVARLARLDVSDDELDRFATQLAAVLEHAADVAALDTAGIPPTAHPFPLVNVLRDDIVEPCLDRDEVLAQAPAAEGGRFRVPRILGEAP